jgi:hypothetical protein
LRRRLDLPRDGGLELGRVVLGCGQQLEHPGDDIDWLQQRFFCCDDQLVHGQQLGLLGDDDDRQHFHFRDHFIVFGKLQRRFDLPAERHVRDADELRRRDHPRVGGGRGLQR